MVDRQVIEQGLRRISDETYIEADRAIQMGCDSYNEMQTVAAYDAFSAGLAKMVELVRGYAGVKAPEFADMMAEVADSLKLRLVQEHESRLHALANGKHPEIKQYHGELLAGFAKSLTDARNIAVSDIRHALLRPDDVLLPWWRRHLKDILLVLLGALAGAVAAQLIGD